MKTKLLLTAVLIGAVSLSAHAGVYFSIGLPLPRVVVVAPVAPVAVVAPACPGQGYAWVPGYWSGYGPGRVWVAGCWRPGVVRVGHPFVGFYHGWHR